jgi:hypothetical protein
MGKGEPLGPPPGDYRVRHRRFTGGIRLQAILSFIPLARGPQAATWASRKASVSEAAEALPLPSDPWKARVTVHSTR